MKNFFKSFSNPQRSRTILLFIFFIGFTTQGFTQKEDSTLIEKVGANKTIKKLKGLITRKPQTDKPFNEKSETAYLKYEGKIIRNIVIKRIGFESSITDTTRVIQNFFSNAANKLHTSTRESVIRNNLFVREGKPLNPYQIADNERSLRNIDFIMDARIHVKPISKKPDSVDLLVITRDVFNLGGSVRAQLPSVYRLNIKDINLNGKGQLLEVGQVLNTNRTPRYGYEVLYQVNNVSGSFIDATIAYTNLNNGISIGNENERSISFKLSRELYQPFARFAGGIELSDNLSKNVYNKPDSLFIPYHYKVQDYWIGYSFGNKNLSNKNLPNNLKKNRNRMFAAVRLVEQRFINLNSTETLTEPDSFAYRDRVGLLSQITFFRQNFYKTQYVLGFGRTEDIPYGYQISFTAGVEKEMGIQRPYIGAEVYYNKVLESGTILTYNAEIGSYRGTLHAEDFLLSFNFKQYSKIHRQGKMIIRNQYEVGYAILLNQHIKRGFNIRDANGLVGFRPDSLVGLQRIRLSEETILFSPWKFLGFRLAPIVRVDMALIKLGPKLFHSNNFFSGISLGLRARNENLIFNTIEARAFYYPVTVEDIGHFRFSLTSNLRMRYPINLVNKPATAFP